MGNVLDEFRNRRQLVQNLTFNEDKLRLTALLDWLDSEVETKRILDGLRRSVDTQSLIPKKGGFPQPPSAKTPAEVQAFGLLLLEGCRRGQSLHIQAHTYNINRFGKRAQDYIDASMEKFIDPLLDFIEQELAARGDAMTPEAVAELRFGMILSPECARLFPKTLAALERVGQFCASAHADGAWFNVGNSCREAFQSFVDELRGHGLVVPDENLKKGDVKGHLRQFLGVTGSSGGHERALVDLIDGGWSLLTNTLHRPASTKDEALRTYLWTSLIVSEVFALAQNRLR